MARTETAGNLITRAKERADMENSNFISTAEWYRSLNVWTAQLWNHLLKADPDRYTRDVTITADSTTQDFSAPDDYYGTVGVDYISDESEGIYIPLPRLYGEEEHGIEQSTANYPLGYTFRYNVADPGTPLLRVLPTPQSGYNLRHRYIVSPPKYATDGTDSESPVAGIAGFEEFVVIGMAIDARIKEESSVVQLRESQAQMLKHLEEMAENRSIDSAGHVHDSRKTMYRDAASFRWGKPDF